MKIINQTANGYIYDKRIFRGAILADLIVLIAIFNTFHWDFTPKFYFKCDYPGPCENPWFSAKCKVTQLAVARPCLDYCKEEWCSKAMLPTGEYGQKQPKVFSGFLIFTLSTIIFGLCCNHILHNKGKKFGVMIDIPDKWKDKIKKWSERMDDE